MATVWVPCDTCKGAGGWWVNGSVMICTDCQSAGGRYVEK